MSGPHHSHPKLSFRQRLRQSLKPSTSSTNPTTTTSTGLTTTQNAVQSSANASTSNTALSLNAGNALQSSQQQQQQQQQFSFPSSISDPLVHKSWQRLSPDDRAVLQQYISPNSVDIHVAVEQALTAATDKRRICLDKRWTYTIAGRNVILREVADKVVRWLDRFKPVGDIIANVDPVHVGLPWAGVRLLLETVVAESNQMAALLVGCETALYMASRLKAYTDFMLQLPATLVRNNLEESIVLMYAHILHFLARAIHTCQTSTTKRVFTAMWKLDEIVEFETRANELANRVERDASNCDRNISAQDRQILAQIQQNLQQVLANLQQFRQLQVSIDQLHLKIDLAKIPYAKGAIFNSSDGTHTVCHPATRVDLLALIQQWIMQPSGKSIYWLHGAAGAGKSTISWTIARWLTDQNKTGTIDLGASFFFKRGQGDRGSAALFFPTIVRQLILKVPGLDAVVAKAIDQDPFIFAKALGEQFRKLLLNPLQDVGPCSASNPTLVIVVDALDECENDADVETILQLWSELSNISGVQLRLFLTSRPDPPIRLKFKQMSSALFEDIILQEAVPLTIIEHDLSIYLRDKFSVIQKQNALMYPTESVLTDEWPGQSVLQILTTMAVPLFIVAATICRFVGDPEFEPSGRLTEILAYRATGQMAQMEMTYLPVLNHLASLARDPKDTEKLYEEFRIVVGAIVCLAEPLSVTDLAILLNGSAFSIKRRLNALHSVLRVPNDDLTPVQTLHLSFAEFLLDKEKQDQPYRIDGSTTNLALSRHCLRLLSGPGGLRENICGLGSPGVLRKEVDRHVIANKLPQVLQYACRYWVHHVQRSNVPIQDDDEVHAFLQKHFLHWLEALSFMGRISEAIGLLGTLQSLVSAANATEVSALLEDAQRYVLANHYVVDFAPLQLYWSAMIFAPQNSVIRNVCGKISTGVKQCTDTPLTWGPDLLKLEGHDFRIKTIALSPIDKILASGSYCRRIDEVDQVGNLRLWNYTTGQEVQKLEGHTTHVNAVTFSPDGLLLASASEDKTIRLWNPRTGQCIVVISDYVSGVRTVSLTNSMLASASDDTIQIWNVTTKERSQILRGHTGIVNAVCFSPDGLFLASASEDKTVILWNLETGQPIQSLSGHTSTVNSVAFSDDSSLLASASNDRTVRIWHLGTGQATHVLNGHSNYVVSVAFAPDGSLLASASYDKTVLLWDTLSFKQIRRLEGHTNFVTSLAFSRDSLYLAFGSWDRTVRLWNPFAEPRETVIEGHNYPIRAVTFSRDGTLLASGSYDGSILLWNPKTSRTIKKLEGHKVCVEGLVFSFNGSLLASGSMDKTARLWDVTTGEQLQVFNGHTDTVKSLAFSFDDALLVSGSFDKTVRSWDVRTGQQVQVFNGHTDWVQLVALSHDGSLLASTSYDETLRLWNTESGEVVRQTDANCEGQRVRSIEFTTDDKSVILCTEDERYIFKFALDNVIHKLPTTCYAQDDYTGKHLFCTAGGSSREWIFDCKCPIIWLPQEYRSDCYAVYRNTLAIGKKDGTVYLLTIEHPCCTERNESDVTDGRSRCRSDDGECMHKYHSSQLTVD